MPITFDVASGSEPGWTTRVVVGAGILERAAREIAERYRSRRIAIVSDARVARLYAHRFAARLSARGASPFVLAFPAGERSKTRETKAKLEDKLLASLTGRETAVVALGGGVTGDLAGFLAATWHRGVPYVQVPTTTLAMCDAALGGKTGVDVGPGKNLVGAFHQPEALFADVETLATLPRRTFVAGLAEAVKIAVALDAALFRDLERDAPRLLAREPRALARLVARVLRLKGEIVAGDPFDRERRAVLNYGHTAAHAIESASAYRIPHGEAVAIGILVEARAAQQLTEFPATAADRIQALLRALTLPVRAPRLDVRRLRAAFLLDKKTRGEVVHCALPVRLGHMPAGPSPVTAVDPVRDLLPFLAPN